jgi:hypothetical protein
MVVFQKKRFTRHYTFYGANEYKDTKYYQSLRIGVFIFCFCLWSWEYFGEYVPSYAMIQVGCFGFTDWKSKSPETIDYHIKNPIIWQFKI